ncbi:unnamed protein product [Arabidopsis lyrata]|uniref:Predicted protein n=1 Tax=Arabidopsis lyrata subsp. lyrata TaxID=81972 RepID=D7KBB5_ARALL|nr:predicted protein [Arabidopsis lyrata subsp. lyrata]CAH8250944.1 unnamed protein product [Arabidopsis lyrata]
MIPAMETHSLFVSFIVVLFPAVPSLAVLVLSLAVGETVARRWPDLKSFGLSEYESQQRMEINLTEKR